MMKIKKNKLCENENIPTMEKGIVTMNQKDRQRHHLLKMVVGGKISLREATPLIDVFYRQAKRLKKKLITEGAKGLVHDNRGRPSLRALSRELVEKIRELSLHKYATFNDTHFTEKLREGERITVGRLRRTSGITPKRRRRVKKHHKRRDRKPQEGMMVQWDGSPHQWFGKDHAPCCLIAAMDDATGTLCEAFFVPSECSLGYLTLLNTIVTRYGIPLSICQDRYSILHRNDDRWTREEQLTGEQKPTQVGAALQSFGITPIFALTLQAKDRIERLFGVLQDRLIVEMEILNIKVMAAPNTFLREHFIEDDNRRFAREPEISQRAWRRIGKDVDIERTISFPPMQ